MGINQLSDDGAVIGYQPNLHYDKGKKTNYVQAQNGSGDPSVSQIVENHTACFGSFVNNTPSKTLGVLDFVTNSMQKTIDKLSKSFHQGKWNQYNDISTLLTAMENGDKELIREFVDFHKYNIQGDIVPELMETVYKTKERLETIKTTLKELYYGNANIAKEEYEEIDMAYVEKIRQYENAGEFCKINYAAISYDSTLNCSISNYAYSANKKCIAIAGIVKKTDNKTSNESMLPTVEKLYKEVNHDIKSREDSYELQQNVEIVQKTLYNYYNKRQELINLYDLLGDSESTYLSRKTSSYQSCVDEAISNVNRTFIGNQSYLSELEKIESEKHFLLNIYSDLSNKS